MDCSTETRTIRTEACPYEVRQFRHGLDVSQHSVLQARQMLNRAVSQAQLRTWQTKLTLYPSLKSCTLFAFGTFSDIVACALVQLV